MTRTRYRHPRRLLLLLMIITGVSRAWGQTIVTGKTYYYQQNYELESDATSWKASTYASGLSLGTGDATHGKYIQYQNPSSNSGVRTAYTNFFTSSDFYVGDSYILEFDAALVAPNGFGYHPMELVVASSGYAQAGNQFFTAKNTTNKNYLFMIRGDNDNSKAGTYFINGGDTEYTIANNTWFHVKLTVNIPDKTVKYVLTDGVSASGTYTITDASSLKAKAIYVSAGRSDADPTSTAKIDNIEIYKLGWDTSLFSAALTNTDNDNKITAGLPSLYDPEITTPEYSYDGTVLGNYDKTFPPRLKATGDGIVTATLGTNTSSFTYRVTASSGGGTYDAANRTYVFDRTGVVSSKSVTDVPGITMSFNGGPTALVVGSSPSSYLKVIDANGYSHPNLGDGANTIPPENNWGGTFYKFVPAVNGTLTVVGNYDNPKIYTGGNVEKTPTIEGSTLTIDLESGTTYYLYNAGSDNKGSNVPLLHSFKFEPTPMGLAFRNPQPLITADLAEGSYTNPAYSAEGKPVTYSITSAAVDGVSIDAGTGKVTFQYDKLWDAPYTITVKATDGSSSASYSLNLVKNTWIFDDNTKWKTVDADLPVGDYWQAQRNNTGDGRNGTAFRSQKKAYTEGELEISSGVLLPETKGLLFTKVASTDRLYVAPKDYSSNYIASRATQIFVPDVQAGQTVTVDWYGTRTSVLDVGNDFNENSRGERGGPTSLTPENSGRVRISSNAVTSYIRSIKVSTPTRAIGTLTYPKTVLNGTETVNRTGYTITDESGTVNLRDEYSGPGNFASSAPTVATVDASGNITAVGTGVAVITATASAENSVTHQASVTLIALVEVVSDDKTRIRAINIEDLKYVTNKSASNGLNRRIPGFDLSFDGGDGAKCNNTNSLILRNGTGKMTITPRKREGETVTITKALITVKSATDTPQWKVNGGSATTVSAGGVTLDGLNKTSLTLESASGSIEISSIKLYYQCSNADNADYCLDETKVAPTFTFSKDHLMRVPGDGYAFTQTPTLTEGDYFKSFDATYTYASSAVGIATINADGTNGQLLTPGIATITATFNETTYFAASQASYTIDNTLRPGEEYKRNGTGIPISGTPEEKKQFIHITAAASASATDLSLTATDAPSLTYGTEQVRQNTFSTSAGGNVVLTNNSSNNALITIYDINVITPQLRAWLYYKGQEENYMEQVQFTGFGTSPVAGFRIVDMGDADNPIDLTDAYELSGNYSLETGTITPVIDSSTGEIAAAQLTTAGTATIKHALQKKSGAAPGYADSPTAQTTLRVLTFSNTTEVEWNFLNMPYADNRLGDGWSYDNRGTDSKSFYYGFFSDYAPILKDGNAEVWDDNHGILLKDEFRYYCKSSSDRGLRANLSAPKSSIKFPVKAGMEVDIYAATSSADITHTITNVIDFNGKSTSDLYIQVGDESAPIHSRFMVKEDGCVELFSTDKVGLYVRSITLRMPEIHFDDDIVTVPLNGDGDYTVTNTPSNVATSGLAYQITAASLFDADGNEEVIDLTETPTGYTQIATSVGTDGVVTLAGYGGGTAKEGWIEVKVTNPSPASSQDPTEGSYRIYVVDFRFDPSAYNSSDPATNELLLNINNADGEAEYNKRPRGYNMVVTPIDYSFTLADGARARLNQYTNPTPALTTYKLTAYSTGTVTLTAKTGRITTSCELTVEDDGMMFGLIAPVLEAGETTFTNTLPTAFTPANTSFAVAKAGDADCDTPEKVTVDDKDCVRLSNITGHGAIRITATDNNGTDGDNSDDKVASFVLTIPYPASTGKKWRFYYANNNPDSLLIGKIGNFTDPVVTNVPKTVNAADNSWHTDTKWSRVYRKGLENERWAYDKSVKCDNAFIIEETAGLQIETGKQSFYINNPISDGGNDGYTHIGLHSNATITIPRLKKDDYVSLNLSRVGPNSGGILRATNVVDLAGTPVDETFTITRSQTDYAGKSYIPGYYTFRVAADGDVSFMLADEGYLDVLSVEIYNNDYLESDKFKEANEGSGIGYDASNGYLYTMTKVRLNDAGYPVAPTTLLKDNDIKEVYDLLYCNPMWSTSVGPAEYVEMGTTKNLDATLENVGWYSPGGAYYVDGRITVNSGYGKIKVRMNNYTAEGKYLIGYTTTYSLTVGHLPHQNYPYTWDFTNISGGEVQGNSNTAYVGAEVDDVNWEDRGSYVYELRTDAESFYVPGATLVTEDYDLGMNGDASDLVAANGYARDEFNGLGFKGKLLFKSTDQPGSVSAAPSSLGTVTLLEYKMSDPNYIYREDLAAGDGTIMFYQQKRIVSATADCGYAFDMDGYNTKYALLTPMRPFRVGDKITIKAYPKSASESSGFSFYTGRYSGDHDGTLILSTTTMSTAGEQDIVYTVAAGDGIAGRNDVYLYYNGNGHSFLTEISITGSYSAPATQSLYSVANTIVTIPDLNADGKQDWIYIAANKEPLSITNATKVTSGTNGPDANTGVYKYKVTAPGNCNITFAGDTEIEKIGVTHILKPMTEIGEKAWATESRDHSIDHALTGYFTQNDVNAYRVQVKEYAADKSQANVKLSPIDEEGYVPANTGLVLKLDNTTNLSKANGGNRVPLFYPSMTASETTTEVDFPANNMMYPHLDEAELTSETETVSGTEYYRFILAKNYLTWRKQDDGAVINPTGSFESRDAAVFYRLHIFGGEYDGQSAATLNTLGANKAYLLLPVDEVNPPIWDDGSPSRWYVGIEDESEVSFGVDEQTDHDRQGTYNLKGQAVSQDGHLPSGVYIKNGRKVVVK